MSADLEDRNLFDGEITTKKVRKLPSSETSSEGVRNLLARYCKVVNPSFNFPY